MPSSYRFAPTCSGSIHVGHLLNCLITFLFARKDGSEFLLRLDRHPHQASFEASIIEDLRAFGFEPDKIVLQREREARYQEMIKQILEEHPDRVYFCDCSVQDITFRGAMGSKMEFLPREEKYPSPCDISSVKIFGPEDPNCDLAQRAEVSASLSARGHGAENLLDGHPETFWRAKDAGYLGEKEPEIVFLWEHERWVSGVEVVYRELPLRGMSIQVGSDVVAKLSKVQAYYYAQHAPSLLRERVSFAPVRGKTLRLSDFCYMHQVRKEYFYDGFCRSRGLKLPLSSPGTTLRIKNEEAWWLPDVAIAFGGNIDLALTSIIDDADYGIELRVRGIDIWPFALLENEAAKLLGNPIPNLFHFMLCDQNMTKYSKFIGSPRAFGMLKHFSANRILSLLAYKAGILQNPEVLSLDELVQACDLRRLRDYRLPLELPYKEIYCCLEGGKAT